MKTLAIAIALACALPAYAQEPDPAQILARPRYTPDIHAQQYAEDWHTCKSWGNRGSDLRACVYGLGESRSSIVVAPQPGVPDMLMCETTRIDRDYSTTDCF